MSIVLQVRCLMIRIETHSVTGVIDCDVMGMDDHNVVGNADKRRRCCWAVITQQVMLTCEAPLWSCHR